MVVRKPRNTIMCTLFSIGGARVEDDAGQVGNPLSHGAEREW